jgi:cyclase
MLKRIIPTLLVENKELIKTVKFSNPTYIGDLLNSVKIYNELEVDELCILDKSARKNGINYKMIQEFANESFSPVSYGGGISKLEQIEELLRIGIEKTIICSSAVNYDFVSSAVKTFGSSTISVCLDYKIINSIRTICIANGRRNTNIDAISFFENLSNLNVGEIIIQSIDNDGTYNGYDLSFLRDISAKCKNPIVISGGCRDLMDIKNAFECGASGAAAGSLFVYYTSLKGILINYPTQEELLYSEINR